MNLNTFNELENALRNWMSFKDQDVYDLNGMAALLAACLDNLEKSMREVDFEEIGGCFTDRQKNFLKKLSECVQQPGSA